MKKKRGYVYENKFITFFHSYNIYFFSNKEDVKKQLP